MESGSKTTPPRGATRRPDLDTVYTINTDGSRNFLHPADVHGRWQVRKNFIWGILLAIYAFVPWIQIGGHPAVHIDLPGRNAFLFGHSFTNQDFYLLFFLVSGLGFALFVVTSLFGRVWCGYACPQTVFMEGVFRRVERWIEGPRDARIRRNLGPQTRDKILRKTAKHVLFLLLAYVNAHVFLSYFIPPIDLVHAVTQPPVHHWAAFVWGIVWTGILYFDYGWFREQTCLIVCPYGRAQSAMHDADTIVIGYDRKRGEPRSKKTREGGDCIDCFRCVAVCPTGIDIRNGLQMECVGCANCVDACDDIMSRIDRPTGLIRYDSQRGFEEGHRRGLLRPRFFLYAGLALVGLAVFGFTASRRDAFEVRMLRAAGLPYVLEAERIRNVYTIRIQNKRDVPGTFAVRTVVPQGAPESLDIILAQPHLSIGALGDERSPIVAMISRAEWKEPFPITIAVTDSATGHTRSVDVLFRGP